MNKDAVVSHSTKQQLEIEHIRLTGLNTLAPNRQMLPAIEINGLTVKRTALLFERMVLPFERIVFSFEWIVIYS